jgi:transcriptional regulator with XRE-family HTH domain
MNYGEALKYQREAANLSQHQLAKETGISQANICRWESGDVLPSIDACVKLAEFYGITLDELIGRNSE